MATLSSFETISRKFLHSRKRSVLSNTIRSSQKPYKNNKNDNNNKSADSIWICRQESVLHGICSGPAVVFPFLHIQELHSLLSFQYSLHLFIYFNFNPCCLLTLVYFPYFEPRSSWKKQIAYFRLLWHGPQRRWRVQQFFCCCSCIRCRGNVLTDPLTSNYRGDTQIYTQTDEKDLWHTPLRWVQVPGLINIGSGTQTLRGRSIDTQTNRR
jgi:hypothetical protein